MRTLYTRATDIRSVAEATLTPAETGLTAVTGANGSGKTTLTTAVPLLAGWGQTPPGTGNLAAIIRDGATSGTVEWAFEIDGTQYVVSRTFRRTKAGAATAKATLLIDGSDKLTTGLKPGDVTDEITRITGMRPDTFLSTSLIAQADVDALMSATPREVRDRVRDILGLRRIASAAEAMANEVRAQELPDAPDKTTVDSLHQRAQVTGARAEDARTLLAEEQARLTEAETTHDAAVATASRINAQVNEAEQSRRAHESALLRDQDARAAAAAADEAYDAALSATGTDWRGSAEEGLSFADEQAQSLRYRLQRHESLSGIAAGDTGGVDAAKKALTVAERAETKAEKDYRTAVDQYVPAAGEVKRTESLVEVLTSTREALAGDGHCPTCGTDVGDSDDLTIRIDAQIAEAQSAADAARAELDRIESAGYDLEATARSTAQARHDAEQALSEAERGVQRVLDARAELDEIGDVSGHAEQIDLMDRIAATAREVIRTHGEVERAAQALSTVTVLDPPDAGDVETARQNYDTTLATVQEIRNALSASSAVCEELTSAAREAHDEWASADQRYTARAEAEKKIAETAAASALLKKFTTAYTAEKVGVITDAVNRLLPLTSGEFTDFRLDEDFAPTVNYAGATRSTSDLSGGERAVLGLLFRIGVTAAMSGGALRGTIIADEPLAALDSEARQRVTSLLSSLPVPVVLVSHTPEAAEAAAVTALVRRSRFGTTEVQMVTTP